MFQLLTLAVTFLCATSSYVQKIQSATTVAENNPNIVYSSNLWILKKWTSFYKREEYSSVFTSTVGDKSFKFVFRWMMSDDESIFFSVHHSKYSDYDVIWWKISMEFLYSNDSKTALFASTKYFDRDVMSPCKKGSYQYLYVPGRSGSSIIYLANLMKIIPKIQDDLPIFVQIWYVSDIKVTTNPSLEYIKSTIIDYQTYTDFGSKVLRDEKTADILVITAQGNRRLHSPVLSIRAPELYNQLLAKSYEDIQCLKPLNVDLNDVKLNIFDHVINFTYTDEIPILKSNDEWKDLLLMSKHFKMWSLEEICIGKLANEVNPNNIMKWYEFAKCNDISKLENYTLEYWRINGLTMGGEKWDNILSNYTNFKCE